MLHFKNLKLITLAILVLPLSSCIKESESYMEQTISFQEFNLVPETYWNGKDLPGSKLFGSVLFYNHYEEVEGVEYWKGFAYSNITNISTQGYENQYSAYISKGIVVGNIYSVVHVDGISATMEFAGKGLPISILVANSTYAYFTMLSGNGSTEAFEEGDWFKLNIAGFTKTDEIIDIVSFYLADYRDGKSFINDVWTEVDLRSLSGSEKITFTLSSSRSSKSDLGIPAYFCIDNFRIGYRN